MKKLIDQIRTVQAAPATAEERDQSITLLFLAASPLILWFFRGGFDNMLAGFAFLGMHLFAFWQLAEGLRAEQEFNAAQVATRPRHPRKLYGAVSLGTAVCLLALYQLGLSVLPLVFGLCASALTLITFGLDPMHDKGMDTPEQVQTYRRRVLSENIRVVLERLVKDGTALGDPEIMRAMREFREMAVRMLIAYENDPANLKDLRKFLRTYLEKAVAETDDFMPVYRKRPELKMRDRFVAQLAELRADCELTLAQYVTDPVSDVDETIEKLIARMNREKAA